MDKNPRYLMEHEGEIERLERKTDVQTVQQQARWAGIQPGMRVADIGCGPGKTTHALFEIVQPDGEAVGIDMSPARIAHANDRYARQGVRFEHRDISQSLDDLGAFDFVWVRFFLEYHRRSAFDIVKNLSRITKPGGILCLIDLDYNCLNHFGMPERLASTLRGFMRKLQDEADFDPHVGIKLYSFLYDLEFEEIDVVLASHHLIYGELKEIDAFNWEKKVEVAAQRSGYNFDDYPGGYENFKYEFQQFFSDPRRFTYTPVIACRGKKPFPRSSKEHPPQPIRSRSPKSGHLF